MHATCLHCTRPLGANEVLETLPIGRRIAFDAAQGRLWVVCRNCAKWNLVPFDTRLESIDAAERLFSDTRTRYSTENIGMARVREGLELVRIGPALRPEFAAWRYGESYRRRRRRTILAGSAGMVVAGGALIAGNFATLGVSALASWMAIEWTAIGWKVVKRRRMAFPVPDPGEPRRVLRLGAIWIASTRIRWEAGQPVLEMQRPLSLRGSMNVARWFGADVPLIGRRALGSLNLLAGRRRELEYATGLLSDHHGDLDPWLRSRPRRGDGSTSGHEDDPLYLQGLPTGERLAIEMWMNEDLERTWLEGELKLLEREWREAERLAAIADGLALEHAQESADRLATGGTI